MDEVVDHQTEQTDIAVIDLNQLSVEKFEDLLVSLLSENKLNKVNFTRELTEREQRIIVNRYIAASYYDYIDQAQALLNFARNYNIDLSKDFDFNYNVKPHNAELQGVNAKQVIDEGVIGQVEGFKNQILLHVKRAVVANDVNKLKQCCAYGINIHLLVEDRLCLEMAVEFGSSDIVIFLLNELKADPLAVNAHGLNAIQQGCKYNRFAFIASLVKSNPELFCDFLDFGDPDYSYGKDLARIIIDLDNPTFLQTCLEHRGQADINVLLDSDAYDRMHQYAVQNNKPKMSEYLSLKKENCVALERRLHNAILSNNLQDVEECLEENVSFSKLLDNISALELACKLGNFAVVELIYKSFDTDKLEIEYSIKYDNADLLKKLLILHYGENGYWHACQDLHSTQPNVTQFLLEMEKKRSESIATMFNLAINGDVGLLKQHLKTKVPINSILYGKSIVHVLCELGHNTVLKSVLARPEIDPNIADSAGDYPLTIACKTNNSIAVRMLLDLEIVRSCSFFDSDLEGYEEKLDVVRLAIIYDEPELLENILKYAQQYNDIFSINYHNITELRDYAFTQQRELCLARLNQYLLTLCQADELFDIKAKTDLQLLADNGQGIARVDPTFIASVKRLCRRYNVKITWPSADKPDKHVTLTFPEGVNKYALLNCLENAISHVTGVKYPVYKSDNKNGIVLDKYLEDQEYHDLARNTLLRLRQSLDPTRQSRWRSKWVADGSEDIQNDVGITLGEAWCLAILAARDINAIPGLQLSAEDIQAREAVLVSALVESARAYFYNVDFHDVGYDPRPSCEHGVAIRAFLALSEMHRDIKIVEEPTEWARDVAEDEMMQVYRAHENRSELGLAIKTHFFQLSAEQSVLLNKFYEDCRERVKIRLSEELGLISEGGYLHSVELDKILNALRYINLPINMEQRRELEVMTAEQADFAQIQGVQIITQERQQLVEYKLPESTDSIFAAVLVSALQQGLSIPGCNTVSDLRNLVANLLAAALDSDLALDKLFNSSLDRCVRSEGIAKAVCHTIKHRANSLHPGLADAEYLQSIRDYAMPDNLVLMLLSALYGANIFCYNFAGAHLLEISPRPLFLYSQQLGSLHLCCDNSYTQANAVVQPDSWEDLIPAIAQMGIRTQDQVLAHILQTAPQAAEREVNRLRFR